MQGLYGSIKQKGSKTEFLVFPESDIKIIVESGKRKLTSGLQQTLGAERGLRQLESEGWSVYDVNIPEELVDRYKMAEMDSRKTPFSVVQIMDMARRQVNPVPVLTLKDLRVEDFIDPADWWKSD